ncbi:MAG: hypothetical protein LIQ31_05630 [Planctomycetes bacterium]|nr:hypothetical protein [Planctomycetota bacterium]
MSSVVSDDPTVYLAQRISAQKTNLARQTAKVTQAKKFAGGEDLNPAIASFKNRQAAVMGGVDTVA